MAETADSHKTGKPIVVDNKMVCKACNKRVYELEKLVMGDVTYHKTCFRCQNCNCVLRLNNFAALNGKNYCKPHFIEAFKLKGNYVSGFADDEDEKAKARKGVATVHASAEVAKTDDVMEEAA